jgi:hypothetical protein
MLRNLIKSDSTQNWEIETLIHKRLKIKFQNFNAGIILVGFFSLLAWTPSYIWIFKDSRIWPWDQAWYASNSLVLADHLRKFDLLAWLSQMFLTTPTKPPLLPWINQIPFLLTDKLNVEAFLLLINPIAMTISSILITVIISKESKSRLAGLASGILLTTSLVAVGVSHQLLVEPLQVAILIASILVIQEVFTKRVLDDQALVKLMILANLNLLIKLNSVVCLLPILVLLFFRIFKKSIKIKLSKPKNLIRLKSTWFVIMLSTLTIFWFIKNLPYVLHHAYLATKGLSTYSTNTSGLDSLIYWIKSIRLDSSLILLMYTSCLVFASLIYFMKRYAQRDQISTLSRNPISFAQIIGLLVAFNFMLLVLADNSDIRFELNLISIMCLAIGIYLSKWNRTILFSLVIIIFCLGMSTQLKLIEPTYIQKTQWDLPIKNNNQEVNEVSDTLNQICTTKDKPTKVFIVVELPYLNPTSWNYYEAKRRFGNTESGQCIIYGNDYAENNLEEALAKIQAFNPDFLLAPTEFLLFSSDLPNKIDLNQVSTEVVTELVTKQEFFKKDQVFLKWDLYKRVID